jgi:hypothetical protein
MAPQQLDGVRVEDRPELGGRTLVAARAFAVGDLVLAEAPLICWPADQADGGAFLAAAAAAAPDVAEALLDFARPALDADSPVVRSRGAFAAAWLAAHASDAPAGWTHAHVHALCLAADTNAHTFLGDTEAALRDGTPLPRPQLALFPIGSKAAHACRPNTLFSSKVGGVLRYVATQPIAAGEPVTFSYLSGAARPRDARRTQLQLSKHFICHCARCAGADDCRGLRCAACGAVALQADGAAAWTCTACAASLEGDALADALRTEAALTARLSDLAAALKSGAIMRRSPTELRALGAQAAAALAPTHWVVARTAEMLVTFSASQRHALEGSMAAAGRPRATPAPAPWPGGGVVSSAFFSALGGEAALEHIRCCECIAAACVGGAKCAPGAPPRHAPQADCAHAALWGVADLRATGVAAHAAAARQLAVRYLPLLRAAYGAEDADVWGVAAWLAAPLEPPAVAAAAAAGPAVSGFCALPQCSALEPQPGVYKLCSACHGPRYCGPVCQRTHWKAHKKSCKAAASS